LFSYQRHLTGTGAVLRGVIMKVNWYRDLSLRWKLLGSFSLVAALGLILALVLVGQLGSLNSDSQFLGLSQIPSVRITKTVDYLLADSRRAELEGIVNTAPAAIRSDVAQGESDEAQIIASLADYGKHDITDAADRADYESVKASLRDYLAHNAPLKDAITDPNTTAKQADAAARLTLPYYEAVHKAISTWTAHNVTLANRTVAHDGSNYRSSRDLAIGLIVVLIVLSLVIALLISRSIKRSVDAVLER